MSKRSATTIGEHMNDADRFRLAVAQIGGKRLTFADLTGKAGQTATA